MEQIGRYIIKKKLGQGGMGVVYSAHDPVLNRPVAIKLLPPHLLDNGVMLEKFKQEAQTIAQLRHPNIVTVYDYGEHQNGLIVQPYFVMELLEGGSLADRLDGRPMPLHEVKRIMSALAPAFEAAHKKQIVHRDVKPGNILFDANDTPHLADFGIARLMSAGTVTMTGTPSYMSPEQWTGKSGVDHRTDLYQIGIIIYQMVTGRLPFSGETPQQAMYQHVEETPPLLREIDPLLPAEWETALATALSKDPTARQRSVTALVDALMLPDAPETHIFPQTDLFDEDELPVPTQILSEPPEKHSQAKLVWAMVGAMGLLLLGGLFLWFGRPNEPQPGAVQTVETGMVQLFIPSGSFTMGSNDGAENESPFHPVTLDAFWIDQTEVTNAQFAQFVEETGHVTTAEREGTSGVMTSDGWIQLPDISWREPRDTTRFSELLEHPVIHVSWEDANAFCAWRGGRLPTEAEWERAARGEDALTYPWGNRFDGSKVNLCDGSCPFPWAEGSEDGFDHVAPVGSFPAGNSDVGAADMSGNVWEWVADWFELYPDAGERVNPIGADVGTFKVLRGGSWMSDENFVRSTVRGQGEVGKGNEEIGFRCADDV